MEVKGGMGGNSGDGKRGGGALKGLWLALGLAACLGGCSSLAAKGGQVLDGTAFGEEIRETYREERAGADNPGGLRVGRIRQRGGGEYIALSFDGMPNLRLRGSLPGPGGAFSLMSLDFFCSSVMGWNEFSRGLSGEGVLRLTETWGVLRFDAAPQALDISGGGIRRKNTRISGDQAAQALKNRQERIEALVEWMAAGGGEFADPRGFEEYWRPRLFPELVPAKKRPPAWETPDPQWVRAEDIAWNRTYTEKLFPEELRPLRDSGALLRDWEEALGWIYLQYHWDRLAGSLVREITLLRE
jgi:hypothetical protein